MVFHVLTLFPEMIRSGCDNSILKRAVAKELIRIHPVNIRDYTKDKHGKVDDYPYGGGAGMLMQAQPVYDAWRALQDEESQDKKCVKKALRTVYVTPQGRPFTQSMAEELAGEEELIFLCGHYEGIDERVLEEIVTDRVSIGDYVLTGGELPAMVMIDAISRLVPGVLNNGESAETESFDNDLLEYPQYSRPEEWHGKKVPEELLSGDHKRIRNWRQERARERTKEFRPDLYEKYAARQEVASRLLKSKKENAYMIDNLQRGVADILYARGDQVIASNPGSGIIEMCCDSMETGRELLGYLPADCRLLLHNYEPLNDLLVREYGFEIHASCYQSVYTQHTMLPVAHKDIRKFPMEALSYAAENYKDGGEDYLRQRIRKGELFAAYVEGEIAGFAGMHDDGSLGILYIEPKFRRLKLGSSLASYLVNKAMERGGIPYAHIREDNIASLKMQEKMGLYTGAKKVFWLGRHCGKN